MSCLEYAVVFIWNTCTFFGEDGRGGKNRSRYAFFMLFEIDINQVKDFFCTFARNFKFDFDDELSFTCYADATSVERD